MNLIEKLKQSFDRDLAAPACIVDGKVMNRSGFVQLVCLTAMNLHRLGVREGDVLGLTMPHAPVHLATILAIARLGAVSIPLHPALAAETRSVVIKKFGVTKVIALTPESLAHGNGAVFIHANELIRPVQGALSLDFINYQPADDLPARLSLTSGTTGSPNAICYTQEYWVGRIERASLGSDATTRMLPGTLHLAMGNIAAFAALFRGGSVVFQALGSQDALWKSIWRFNVTHAIVTPADLQAITEQTRFEGLAFPSLRDLRVVGGALSDRLFQEASKKVTARISTVYGASEVGLIALADAQTLQQFPNTCGKPGPGVEIQAISPEGDVLPPGEIGEFRVRTPGMPSSYHNNPQRSRERFKDGWYYTGDMGRISPEGYVYLQGRTDTRINISGLKFLPENLETMLERHPRVKVAGVFAVDGASEQEKRLVAAIVPVDKTEPPQDLAQYCQQLQVGLMTPHVFLLVNELPLNLSGKLDRAAMLSRFSPLLAGAL